MSNRTYLSIMCKNGQQVLREGNRLNVCVANKENN